MNGIRRAAEDSQARAKAVVLHQSYVQVAPTTQKVSDMNVQPHELPTARRINVPSRTDILRQNDKWNCTP
jgi:hypothetical protein